MSCRHESGGAVQKSFAIRRAASMIPGICAFGILCGVAAGASTRENKPARSVNSSIDFKKAGSADATPVRYVARSRSFDVYASREETDIMLHGGLEQPRQAARGRVIVVHAYANVLRIRFVNSDLPTTVEPLATRRAGSTKALAYRGIYPGTDAVLSATKDGVAFQLDLSPGADARNVVLEIGGATSIDLDSRGDAVVHVGREAILLQRPAVKIQPSTNDKARWGAYRIEGPNRLRFVVSGSIPKPAETISD